MAWPFNSSNTAEESPAMTSNRCVAEKCRVSPAESSVSRSSLPSPMMRTRVGAEGETESSKEELAEVEEMAGGSGGTHRPASEVGCDIRIEVGVCLAARWAE